MDSKRFFTRFKPQKHLFPTEVLPDSDQSSQGTDQEMEDAGKQRKYPCHMAFKCLTSRVPEYLTSQFSKRGEISGRATRSSQMLNIPLFKTASGQRTFYYRTVSIWNSMDSSLKTLEKVSDFKYFLKRKLIKDFIDC